MAKKKNLSFSFLGIGTDNGTFERSDVSLRHYTWQKISFPIAELLLEVYKKWFFFFVYYVM